MGINYSGLWFNWHVHLIVNRHAITKQWQLYFTRYSYLKRVHIHIIGKHKIKEISYARFVRPDEQIVGEDKGGW